MSYQAGESLKICARHHLQGSSAEYCVRWELFALVGLSDRDGRRVWLEDTATKLAQFAKTLEVLEKDLERYDKNAIELAPSSAKLFDQLGTWYLEADRRERVLIGKRRLIS